MPLPKPSSKPDWTSANPTVRTEPSGSKKNSGWATNERPAYQFFNWLFFNIDEWIDYLESVTDAFVGYQSIYSAFVGTGGLATHASINDAITDVPAGSKILVLNSATINTVQSISKNNITVEFKPGVIYTKGTAQYAIQVQADHAKIVDGIFEGFSGGSDAGIRVDNTSDFSKIRDCHFKNCTVGVDDQSVNGSLLGETYE